MEFGSPQRFGDFFFFLFHPHFSIIVSLINVVGWLVWGFGGLLVCLFVY